MPHSLLRRLWHYVLSMLMRITTSSRIISILLLMGHISVVRLILLRIYTWSILAASTILIVASLLIVIVITSCIRRYMGFVIVGCLSVVVVVHLIARLC